MKPQRVFALVKHPFDVQRNSRPLVNLVRIECLYSKPEPLTGTYHQAEPSNVIRVLRGPADPEGRDRAHIAACPEVDSYADILERTVMMTSVEHEKFVSARPILDRLCIDELNLRKVSLSLEMEESPRERGHGNCAKCTYEVGGRHAGSNADAAL